MCGESDGDGSGACADVENARMCGGRASFFLTHPALRLRYEWGSQPVEDSFDEELGFGAWDERVRRDTQGEAKEFLNAGEVLQRRVRSAAGGEGAEPGEVRGGECVVDVGEDEGTVALENVGEESFGVAWSDVGGGFGDGGAKSHKCRQ